MSVKPLTGAQLRRHCDAASLGFETTRDLKPVAGLIGQGRALDALEFGTELEARGYNIFVLGTPGSGRHNAVRHFLEGKAKSLPAPRDWVYVHNFDESHRPKALSLPAEQAPKLARLLDTLLETLKTAMPAVFEGEDYQERRNAIEGKFKDSQEQALKALSEKAQKAGLALTRSPQGFAVFPVSNGEPVKPEIFQKLPKAEREKTEAKIKEIHGELEEIMRSIPKLDKERRESVRVLNRQLAEVAIDRAMEDLFAAFKDQKSVTAHLKTIRGHLADNSELFVQAAQQNDFGEQNKPSQPLDLMFNKYKANVLVCHPNGRAPVEYLDFPGLGHLLGRIEYMPHMGAMLTDFTLIKPGALHTANGGYLIVDAERLLRMPGSWEALKRCLRGQAIAIEAPTTGMSTTTAVTLEPEPIPLDVKVVLIGQRQTFYLLQQLDIDFSELFKVAADFDEVIDWSKTSIKLFCRLLGSIARREKTLDLTANACAYMIERAARLSNDRERLTLRVSLMADLVREANYWAEQDNATYIERAHVVAAVKGQIERLDRIRERMHEQITRDTILIDTAGEAVGQINGLSVLQIGALSFGKPTRITARTRIGQGKVIDIEREVELGGSLHSKGVLILSGFISARYATSVPASLSATLVFEQSYGGVDGDSASSTELYALLSALSDVPIDQGLAVTGSVNQNGDVQAIGGANEKIEGYFDICKARGLTGHQGVLIPKANVKHLMLREDVVAACKAGQFRVFPVNHIDEGIEILTGKKAGKRTAKGIFPEDTINRMVEDKLLAYAKARRDYIARSQ